MVTAYREFANCVEQYLNSYGNLTYGWASKHRIKFGNKPYANFSDKLGIYGQCYPDSASLDSIAGITALDSLS